ncbi:YbaN family protein [Rhodovulum steppense]|uniref:Inner membrane protein n=1 Tax=Rhodovulum steppense TaxID=540251 RepID=A0A4R1YIU1_9RHOB|nr:YbaN family protein [Rhodovulum steppense]TCM76395.1 hypothetical protein EV216_13423 [Rhodovulum steppense]
MIVLRVTWGIVGLLSLGLGILGMFLPLLPTTGFLLIAAFCFARSSPALHDWLVNHRHLGGPITSWREHRAISTRSKRLAIASMGAAFLLSVLLGMAGWVLALQAVVLTTVGTYLVTRPTPPEA